MITEKDSPKPAALGSFTLDGDASLRAEDLHATIASKGSAAEPEMLVVNDLKVVDKGSGSILQPINQETHV